MLKRLALWTCLLTLPVVSHAVTEETISPTIGPVVIPEVDQTTSSEESESKGIIPRNAYVQSSTEPITPTSVFPPKAPYDQAREGLIRALALWNEGHAEAASDTALEAYEDLKDLRRVPGVKRTTIRAQTQQAATVYVEAGIAYIKDFVVKGGSREEGRGRLEDLRDVARSYPALNKMLNNAIREMITPPTTPKTT